MASINELKMTKTHTSIENAREGLHHNEYCFSVTKMMDRNETPIYGTPISSKVELLQQDHESQVESPGIEPRASKT